MMTSLDRRLDAKADLMMRKLDEILRGSNQENRSGSVEDSRLATDGFGTHRHAEAPLRLRTSFESNHRERLKAAPSRVGWTNPMTPDRGHACPRGRRSDQYQI